MCKDTQNNQKLEEKSEKLSFKFANSIRTETNLNVTDLSNVCGALLLQEIMRKMEIASELASCITDIRISCLVKHSLNDIIFTSIL